MKSSAMYIARNIIIFIISENILLAVSKLIKVIIYLVKSAAPTGLKIQEKYLIFSFVTFTNCLILKIPFNNSLMYITSIYPYIE